MGVALPVNTPRRALTQLQRLLAQAEASPSPSADLLRVLRNSREVGQSLQAHLNLLADLEALLLDWMWGMAYHFTHARDDADPAPPGQVH